MLRYYHPYLIVINVNQMASLAINGTLERGQDVRQHNGKLHTLFAAAAPKCPLLFVHCHYCSTLIDRMNE